MNRKITGFDFEIADKLKHTKKPFSTRMAQFVTMESIGDIQLLRTFADCVIELELAKDKAQNELIEYKKRFGELN